MIWIFASLFTLILLFCILVGIYFVLYNTIISRRNKVGESFSSIEIIEKQRQDQLSMMVSLFKKYLNYESSLLTEIISLRSKSFTDNTNTDPTQTKDEDHREPIREEIEKYSRTLQSLPKSLVGSLKSLVEDNPEIKADVQSEQILDTIEELERMLQAARRNYNATVIDYNNAVTLYPTKVVANIKGYQTLPYLKIEESERERPDITSLLR